jgi:hypothetical protein
MWSRTRSSPSTKWNLPSTNQQNKKNTVGSRLCWFEHKNAPTKHKIEPAKHEKRAAHTCFPFFKSPPSTKWSQPSPPSTRGKIGPLSTKSRASPQTKKAFQELLAKDITPGSRSKMSPFGRFPARGLSRKGCSAPQLQYLIK